MTRSPEERAYRRARRLQREEQVVEALRREGIVTSGVQAARLPPRRRSALLRAAVLVAVVGSAASGYQLGRAARSAPAASSAVEVQQAGDAYVRTLRELGSDGGASVATDQAREVGVAALLAAASALAEAAPADSAMWRVIRQLHGVRIAARTEGGR